MAEQTWETSVQELMLIFRDALAKLIPDLQRARIPIGSVPGVDAWDEISEALFRHIVVEAIRASLPELEMEDLRLPQYEMTYEDYRDLSFIEVIPNGHPHEPARRLVFQRFEIAEERDPNISRARCIVVDDRGAIKEKEPEQVSVDDVTFRCCYRRPRLTQHLDKLTVVL